MPVTIRDLAEKLHLSITTVSRALDGYGDVAEETRQRVILAAQEAGYQPNASARQLRRKRTNSLGFILPTSSPQFSDPFYVRFLSGLCDEVASLGLDLLITSCPPHGEQEKALYQRWVQSRRVDGLVLNRTRIDDWRVQYLIENHLPFVALGKSESEAPYPSIEVDDQGGFRQLVVHLANMGHRRIAFIGAPPGLVLQADRFAGYQQGLAEAGLPFDPYLVQIGDLSEAGGFQAAQLLLDLAQPPTAILGVNDITALGVMHAAKERGLVIGSQLAIAGYDGIQEAEYSNPPLTTIYQPTYDIARRLARMLVDLVLEKPVFDQHIVIRPQLMIRPSTG